MPATINHDETDPDCAIRVHTGGPRQVAKPGDVASPMPGRVVKVLVSKEQTVNLGDPVLIIEAMKMESRVPAPISGKVVALYVKEGDDVKTDETLVQLE